MAGARTTYLDPAILARLGSLDLKAKTIVEGFLTGLHRSPFRGFSVEFAEYRQYMPGDDLQYMDWKVFARSDRHYVKKFEEETNLDCFLLLDVSASMGYGSRGVSKMEYGAVLAASLAYLMHRQRDAVGLITFDDHVISMLPPSARPGHLRAVTVALEKATLGATTDVAKPLEDLARAIRKRGLVIVISDLLDDPVRIVDGLKRFHHRGTDVIVFQLLDHDELAFPFERPARFRDPETADEVVAVPSAVRDDYLAAVGRLTDAYRIGLGGTGVDYHLLDTSQPLEVGLMRYLTTRGRAL
jgi:uncharacterized protein (DUF58 family)